MEQLIGQRPGHEPAGPHQLGPSRQIAAAGSDVQAWKGQQSGACRVRVAAPCWIGWDCLNTCVMEGQASCPGGEKQGTEADRPLCSIPHCFISSKMALLSFTGNLSSEL